MAAPMSDVSGYRSDGGALGQDQGVSKQLRSILTAKLPLLSAPGTVLENSLYYDINSSSVTAVEEQATFNKDRISLNNPTIGGISTAYIPSVLFANTVYWVARLKNLSYGAGAGGGVFTAAESQSITRNLNIPEGWGFSAINNILVYMGASSIAQIQISGKTNFHVMMATCETQTKRREVLEGAGRYLNNRDSASVLANTCSEGTLAVTAANPNGWYFQMSPNPSIFIQPAADNSGRNSYRKADWLGQCRVPLRLPWTSLAVLDKRLSLDTRLSTQPIQITLDTAAPTQFIVGTDFLTRMDKSWEYSTIQLWQEELSDKSLSVRNELLAMPEFNVGYPFQYAQSIDFNVAASSNADVAYDSTIKFKVNITSIINSDLTTFLFSLGWGARETTAANSGQFCPNFQEQILNIELLLNGQRFFAFDDESYEYVTLAKVLDPVTVPVMLPGRNTTLNIQDNIPDHKYYSVPQKSYIYEFNNSRLRSIIAESHLQNTARFTNQTFQLSFQINRARPYLLDPGTGGAVDAAQSGCYYNAGTSSTEGLTLHMTFLYNAVYLIGGDGGTTKLITN